MLQFAVKRAAMATQSLAPRLYATSSARAPQHEGVVRRMIEYSLGHTRSHKSGESYAQAMMILEQGLSNVGGGGDAAAEYSRGMMFMLTMSTLLYERGELRDAVEKLQMVAPCPLSKGISSTSLRYALKKEIYLVAAVKVDMQTSCAFKRTEKEKASV